MTEIGLELSELKIKKIEVASILDAIVPKKETSKSDEMHVLKSSSSCMSLIGDEQREVASKYNGVELGALARELRSRERETRKLYEQFCNLHDEKKRLLKKFK